MSFKMIKKGKRWGLLSGDSKVVMGKTLYRLVKIETGEKGGFLGLDVEMDETSWVDSTSYVMGKVVLKNYTQITDYSAIQGFDRVYTFINYSELNYSTLEIIENAFAPNSHIKIAGCRFDYAQLIYKPTFPIEGLIMENCKFIRYEKFSGASPLYLTSGVYKNLTGDNFCKIEFHLGKVSGGSVDRVVMEDVHLGSSSNISIGNTKLVYMNNVVISSGVSMENFDDTNYLSIVNEKITKEWKGLK